MKKYALLSSCSCSHTAFPQFDRSSSHRALHKIDMNSFASCLLCKKPPGFCTCDHACKRERHVRAHVQAMCWQVRAAAALQLLAALLLLVPCFNFFGGMALLHGYLAASGQTSYEICKGAKAHPCSANLISPNMHVRKPARSCMSLQTNHRHAGVLTERSVIAMWCDKRPRQCQRSFERDDLHVPLSLPAVGQIH